jgi:fructose-1,6-bisphosphatase/sedoheptulose 1,7-bisphosphatase-like protein
VDTQLAWLRQLVIDADADIIDVDAEYVSEQTGSSPPLDEREAVATLTAAIAAAARAAGRLAGEQDCQAPLAERKVAIDTVATSAAEAILSRGNSRITVSAGEGERDGSPGAQSGQVLGSRDAPGPSVDGIFDYVDGTTLAAETEPGALALGAIGRGVRSVPDLQAFAVIGPRDAIAGVDLTPPFEECASRTVAALADFLDRPVSELTIVTHSLGSRPNHLSLIERLRGVVGEVIVPPGVTVEPPYLLSLVGLSKPKIDALVGGIGLSELSYAAALLDIIAPDFGIKFRIASVEGPRNSAESTVLDSFLDFTPDELSALERHSLSSSAVYSGQDLLVAGGALAASMFAVTPNVILDWRGASESRGRLADGLLALRGGPLIKLEIRYQS